jgi:CRP-like cAMP-binding protein
MNTLVHQRSEPGQNQLLAALPDAAWSRWQTLIEPVELGRRQWLCDTRSEPAWVYFPTTAIVSLLCRTRDGESAEIAVVGNDGVVGMPMLMGGDSSTTQAVVQSAGQAYRLPMYMLLHEIDHGGPVLDILMRYAQSMIAQMAQTALCNRCHSIDQQLCRRLLLGLDRLSSDEMDMTQELAASLLGVRREGVTGAALKLQHAGVIRYNRGHIVVLDRQRLEQSACECYAVTRREYQRSVPMPLAA